MKTKELDIIAQFLLEESALCFAGRRRAALRCHLEGRVARLGLTLGEYLDLLRSSAEERSAVYQLVTVNETSFFRNRQQFEDLKSTIVPRLEEEKGRRLARDLREGSGTLAPAPCRKLRILSAGCSTGEEPYSVAMTLLEAVRYPLAWDLKVVAGDLSEECLQVAARGHYSEARVKGIPAGYRDRYLRKEGAGWSVSNEVKALVSFQQLNLSPIIQGDRLPGLPADFEGFDAIFCRNVMIYFPPASQQLLIEALERHLAPGGYLFTGDAEPLHLYRHGLERVEDLESLVYRKAAPPKISTASPLPVQGALAAPAAVPAPTDPPAPAADPLSRCSVEDLLTMVADSALGFRKDAMQELLMRGLPSLAAVLEAAVGNDGNAELRNGAMEVLVAFGERAVPMLSTLLRDPNEEVRNFCTVMLGSIASASSLSPLIAALDDPAPNVRHGAAEALGKIGDECAVEPLLRLLDQGFWLQFPAVEALGQLGSPSAVPRLLELLDDELLFEPAVQALRSIGDSRALPALQRIARGADPRRARVATKAIEALEGKDHRSTMKFAARS